MTEPQEELRGWRKFGTQLVGGLGGGVCALGLKEAIEGDYRVGLPMAAAGAVLFVVSPFLKKFFVPIQSSLENLGERSGDALVGRVASTGYSRFEEEYLKKQASRCLYDDIEGRSRELVPVLKDVFIPLELSAGVFGGDISKLPMGRGTEEQQEWFKRLDNLDIWFFLSRLKDNPSYRQISIQALGGYGKTTLLKHVAYIFASGDYKQKGAPKMVPFFVRLRDWGTVLGEGSAPDLAEFLRDHHIKKLGLDVPSGWLEETLKKGRALVLFDGFDEVPESTREAVGRWLGRQMQIHADTQSVFITTSRPAGYEDVASEDRARTGLFVKPFSSDQMADFVRRWYACQEKLGRSKSWEYSEEVAELAEERASDLLSQIRARQDLANMTRNPLMLNMVAYYHRIYQGSPLPRRRGELYQEIFQLQLRSRPREKHIKMLLPDTESQELLQGLALGMLRQNRVGLSRREFLAWLEALIKDREVEVKAGEFLQQMVQVAELVVERERQEYEFSHLSFQEYLAAAEVKEQRLEVELLENYRESHWQGTIILYSALTNPNSLLRGLLAEETTEAAELAYKCLQETPRQVDDEVRSKLPNREQKELEEQEQKELEAAVRTVRFQQLEELLSNAQWKDADYETYRVMIRTVGKEEGSYFSRQDLETFPCEELRELDRLWVKYSESRWGFSVQKRIWQECGSPTEYNADWEAFGDRVGWREQKEWTYKMNYDPSQSPRGHLPVIVFGLWEYVRGGGVAQRAVTCNL